MGESQHRILHPEKIYLKSRNKIMAFRKGERC